MCGVISESPMPTFPDGFPEELLEKLSAAWGRGILCNKPYSGTQVIADYGREHIETGKLIVYTSADSVLQIAAHESVVRSCTATARSHAGSVRGSTASDGSSRVRLRGNTRSNAPRAATTLRLCRRTRPRLIF